MRIYLWGPSGTGKTWLFDAFIRKINLIDDALIKIHQPSFTVWMEDVLRVRQYRYTLEAKRTIDIDYQEYTLYRDYLADKQNTIIRLACTQRHQLMMLDGPGDETTGEIALTANTEENRAKVLAAYEALKDSDYVILCVERGIHASCDQDIGKSYAERLSNLLSLNRKSGQKVVICFTKSDLYGGKVAGFDATLERLFGRWGSEVGALLRELSRTRTEPPHFFVSAVGYYHNPEGKVTSNFDKLTNELIEPINWNPDSVELPFFWIFTDADRRLLRNIEFEPTLPSYLPRFLSDKINKRLADSFRQDLISAYISYEAMIRELKVNP